MRILYITAENIYGTGSSNIRNVSMIEGISALGNEVSILSFEVNENTKKFDENIKERLSPYNKYFLTNRSLQKVFAIKKGDESKKIVSRLKTFVYRWAKKIYLRFSSTDTLSQAVSRANPKDFPSEQYDVVISSSDPISSHSLAEMFFKTVPQNNCKWLQYWGDPMLLDITRTNKNKRKLKKIEGSFLRKANKIVYTNPLIVAEQKKIYSDCAEKMHFVPTPFSFYDYGREQSNEYDVGYFGSYMSCVRDILPLCTAVTASDKRMIVMGGGDQALPKDERIDNRSFQSTSVVAEYESKCTLLVCLCNTSKSGNRIYQIPGKIYHYAVTDKPVLIVGADEATKEFLESYNRFVFCDNDASQITQAIEDIINGTAQACFEPIEDFSPRKIAEEFIK